MISTRPTTSATINGKAPESTYTGPVDVALTASDTASGVAQLEYRTAATGAWTTRENTASAEPFVVNVAVASAGEHRIQYRAVDKTGNVGAIKTLAFTVEDRNVSDVYASDAGGKTSWVPDAIRVAQGQTVTWHFDSVAQGGQASAPHNVYLVRPGDDPLTQGFRVGDLAIPPGGAPVNYKLDRQGTWTFYCSLHAVAPPGATNWTGMVGTAEVGAAPADDAAPTTTATVTGDGTAAATVRLSAADGAGASGVAHIDYAVNGALPADGSAGPGVTRLTNAQSAEPFAGEFQLSMPGTYTHPVPRHRPRRQPGGGQDAHRHRDRRAVGQGPGRGQGEGDRALDAVAVARRRGDVRAVRRRRDEGVPGHHHRHGHLDGEGRHVHRLGSRPHGQRRVLPRGAAAGRAEQDVLDRSRVQGPGRHHLQATREGDRPAAGGHVQKTLTFTLAMTTP